MTRRTSEICDAMTSCPPSYCSCPNCPPRLTRSSCTFGLRRAPVAHPPRYTAVRAHTCCCCCCCCRCCHSFSTASSSSSSFSSSLMVIIFVIVHPLSFLKAFPHQPLPPFLSSIPLLFPYVNPAPLSRRQCLDIVHPYLRQQVTSAGRSHPGTPSATGCSTSVPALSPATTSMTTAMTTTVPSCHPCPQRCWGRCRHRWLCDDLPRCRRSRCELRHTHP